MVVNDASVGVSMDEANILADFFNLQANKHGPELLKKLNNLGGGGGETPDDEQRHRIKIEDEAETVMKHAATLQLERGHRKHDLVVNNSQKQLVSNNVVAGSSSARVSDESVKKSMTQHHGVQYLVSQPGNILSMLPDTFFRNLPLLQQQHHQDTQGYAAQSAASKRGVSVIQKTPQLGSHQRQHRLELNNPNIILERRRLDQVPGKVGAVNTVSTVSRINSLGSVGSLKQASPDAGVSSTSIKGRQKSNQQQSDHLICEVCGERAGKHSYYGGQVCPSCRAFFRRSVQSRYNETFKCTKGPEVCLINLLTRKTCQYCRYQKCLAAGMRPSWILSDEERVRRFQGRNVKGKNRQKMMKEDTEPMIVEEDAASVGGHSTNSSETLELNDGVADDNLDSVEKIGGLIRRVCTRRHDDLDSDLLQSLVQLTSQGGIMTAATAAQLSEVIQSRSAACLQLLPEFQSLDPRDQAAIIQHNLPLIHRFRQSLCLMTPHIDWRMLAEVIIGSKLGEEEENLPTDLSGSPKKPFQYESFFTSPFASNSSEYLHKEALMRDIASRVDVDDEHQLLLMLLILAFNHDFLDLKNRQQVEKIQLKYVVLLQIHMRSKYANSLAACKLTKALMLPAVARELVQVTKNCFII